MAITKCKSEGGHKRGHSNMTHYDYTEEIKRGAKKARRQQDRKEERLAFASHQITNAS